MQFIFISASKITLVLNNLTKCKVEPFCSLILRIRPCSILGLTLQNIGNTLETSRFHIKKSVLPSQRTKKKTIGYFPVEHDVFGF